MIMQCLRLPMLTGWNQCANGTRPSETPMNKPGTKSEPPSQATPSELARAYSQIVELEAAAGIWQRSAEQWNDRAETAEWKLKHLRTVLVWIAELNRGYIHSDRISQAVEAGINIHDSDDERR